MNQLVEYRSSVRILEQRVNVEFRRYNGKKSA